MLLQLGDHAGHRRVLLADGHVEALHAGIPLVDDRVDRDGRLARLAVADDQLALPAADRRHGVHGLQTGLQRLAHRLAFRHAGGDHFHRAAVRCIDRALAVQRIAQRIEHAAQHGLADRHGQQPAQRPDLVPFVDAQVVAEDDDADAVLVQVEGLAQDPVGELDHFVGHHARQPVDPGDAVADFQHGADFAHVDLASNCSISACRTLAISSALNFIVDLHSAISNRSKASLMIWAVFSTASCRSRTSQLATLASYTVSPTRTTSPPIKLRIDGFAQIDPFGRASSPAGP